MSVGFALTAVFEIFVGIEVIVVDFLSRVGAFFALFDETGGLTGVTDKDLLIVSFFTRLLSGVDDRGFLLAATEDAETERLTGFFESPAMDFVAERLRVGCLEIELDLFGVAGGFTGGFGTEVLTFLIIILPGFFFNLFLRSSMPIYGLFWTELATKVGENS